MFDTISTWVLVHAEHAPLFVFGLLLLTGFSIPVSEDLIVIVSGVLAGTVLQEQMIPLFLAAYIGSFCSDVIAYWIGRFLGKTFSQASAKRETVKRFFQRYGFLTLLIGRLIPFGIRNSVFMVAGAGKMHFGRFVIIDGIGCLLFSSSLFFLAYQCGENYSCLQVVLSSIGYIAISVTLITTIGWYLWPRFLRTSKPSLPS
jgi:membrane-associated protein